MTPLGWPTHRWLRNSRHGQAETVRAAWGLDGPAVATVVVVHASHHRQERSSFELAATTETETVLDGEAERHGPGAVGGRWWKYLLVAGLVAALIVVESTRPQQGLPAVAAFTAPLAQPAAVAPAAPTIPPAPVSTPTTITPPPQEQVTTTSTPVASDQAKQRHHKRRTHRRGGRQRAAR